MLLAFIFILLSIGVGILVSVYSIFLPFITNLGEIGNFNTAYYGAIASIERAELVLKNKEPGFQGSGGYLGGTGRGPNSDQKTGEFGFINIEPNGMRWEINSRTTSIPNAGEGNVEYLLASNDSDNYNMLDYSNAEKILLSIDSTTNPSEYYTGGSPKTYYNGGSFTGEIRLPPKVFSGFGEGLCESCDANEDLLGDDIIVDRSLEGKQGGMYFKILPNIAVLYSSGSRVNEQKDIAIRESVINKINEEKIYFGRGSPHLFDPIGTHTLDSSLLKHVAIASNPGAIENEGFLDILGNYIIYTGLELNLGLIQTLLTQNDNLYPFLEYQFHFPQNVADKFYTIQGNSRVGEYDVQVIVKKPTHQGSVAGSFTVIF